MQKIGFIVDSSCGLSAAEAAVRHWGYLPLIISVDGQEYHDGVDVDNNHFYREQLKAETDVRTSATPPGLITKLYQEMSVKYEHVLVFGLSQELSSQTSNLRNFARPFPNVHVVNSQNVGHFIIEVLEHLEELSASGKDFDTIVATAADLASQQFALIIPKTMRWFVKGGRITPAAASLAKVLQIVPVLSLDHGKIERYGKGRTYLKTIDKALCDLDMQRTRHDKVAIYHGMHREINEISAMAKRVFKQNVEVYPLPPVIAVHTGPEAIAIVISKLR